MFMAMPPLFLSYLIDLKQNFRCVSYDLVFCLNISVNNYLKFEKFQLH